MSIELMSLPYSTKALAPIISNETLEIHHGKHHKGYVDKVNAAIEGTDLADADLETIIKASSEKGDNKLFNSAAQTWNHGFYWHSLAPESSEPSGDLAKAIERDFGSMKDLKAALGDEATGHFASGWAWLAEENGKLKVLSTHDAGTLVTEAANPLLVIDVWEHAYYVDVRNDRGAYVKDVLQNCLNWDFASKNFERGSQWTYPADELAQG
jgi:Fe-Mn family superoxide dismutase